VLEQESGVDDVERPPLVVGQRKIHGVAVTDVEQMLLAVHSGLALGLGALVGITLDADDRPAVADLAGQHAGELPEAGADVEDPFPSAQRHGSQRRRIQQRVQPGESPLLRGFVAVNVVEIGSVHWRFIVS